MGEVRRQYGEEFKRNAVELTRKSGKKVSQVAEDLGINSTIEGFRQPIQAAFSHRV